MEYANSNFYKKALKKVNKVVGHDNFNIISMKTSWKGPRIKIFIQLMEYEDSGSYRIKELEVVENEDSMCIYNAYGIKIA